MKVLRIAGVAGLLIGLTVSAHGANVLIAGGTVGGETELELKALLESMGHIVPLPIRTFNDGPPSAADLASTDLILVSRSVDSTQLTNTAGEAAAWNSINKPLLLMSPQVSRGGPTGTNLSPRWGWLNVGATIDNRPAPENFDAFPNASHPFVAGRTTSVYPAGVTIDLVNATSANVPVGATVVATLSTTDAASMPITFAGIVDYPAGTQLFADINGTQTVIPARRALWQMWEYPDVANRAFELTANGNMILDQIIDTLAPTTTQPGDVNLDGQANLADYVIIRNNFQKTGQTRAQGDLNADGNVNFLDFRIWKNFRTGAGAGTAFEFGDAVPEPGSVLLVLLGACAATGTARYRRAGAR